MHNGPEVAAVFLDRDGVLNRETGYITRPEELELLPGVAAAVAKLNRAGYPVIVFTNQSAVGRGRLSLEGLARIHNRLKELLHAEGAFLTDIAVCPHGPDEGCDCRKPLPGLLLAAAARNAIDLRRSYAVGDSSRDIAAGADAGCTTLLVLTGHTKRYVAQQFPDPQPDLVCADLPEAVDIILSRRQT